MASDKHITVFGEFCGKGIQKNVAISQIDRKIFAVFAIQYGGTDGEPAVLDINPITILDKLGSFPEDVYVLPFYGDTMFFNFTNVDELKKQAEELNKVIAEVESCDPWVKNVFDIEGIGEGVVMYPLLTPKLYKTHEPILIDVFQYSDLVFKAKGEKHKVVNTKKAVQIDPEIAKSIESFVELFVVEARLNQMLDGLDVDPKNIGEFIKKMSIDIQKESVAELEAAGLTWKEVVKDLSMASRKWFLNRCKEM